MRMAFVVQVGGAGGRVCRSDVAKSSRIEREWPLLSLREGGRRIRSRVVGVRASAGDWEKKLTEEEFRVTRNGGTEKPFTGALLKEYRPGSYTCKCCGELLFNSEEKYDSGTGWPSFTAPASEAAVKDKLDLSNHMFRFEVLCNSCDAHLGHHFPDVTPTGLRYCINSVALAFSPRDESGESTSDAEE